MGRQGLCGVPGHGLHQGPLVAPARDRQPDGPTALHTQPVGQNRRVGRGDHRGHQHAARHVGLGLGVHLGQQRGDQLRLVGIIDTFHDEATLPPDPTVAHVEHPHACLQLVACQSDDIGIGPIGQDDCVALQHPLQRLQVVAKAGSALIVHLGGGRLHHVRSGAHECCRVPRHEGAEVVHDRSVLLGGDLTGAGRSALVDVPQQAGPPRGLGTSEHALGARAHREDPQELVDGLPDGPCVREGPEVAHAAPLVPAHHHGARELLADGHRQERVGLVVAVPDVEPRIELLDPRVLEGQRLHLVGHHDPVQGPRCGDHGRRPLVQATGVLEVGGQPRAQVLRLAHVDDPAMPVTEAIDPGFGGDLPGGGTEVGGHLRRGRSPHPRPGWPPAPVRSGRGPPADPRCFHRTCCRGSCR